MSKITKSTAPDIVLLTKKWPLDSLELGQTILYRDIEDVIGDHWRSQRFRSVTARWRQIIEDQTKMILDPIRGKGFRVAPDAEKVTLVGKKIGEAFRKAARSVQISKTVDRKKLTESDRKTLEFHDMRTGKLAAVSQLRRQLAND